MITRLKLFNNKSNFKKGKLNILFSLDLIMPNIVMDFKNQFSYQMEKEKLKIRQMELNGNISTPFKIITKNQEIGIGTDIENMDKFKGPYYSKENLFLKKIFTKNELNYCFSKFEAAPHLTARFSGKEAIFKALNSIEKVNLNYKEIEILNSENGVPVVNILNKKLKEWKIKLSLSHCDDKAMAFALVRKIKN